MNKNKDYFEFVESIKKEVQHMIKDWKVEVVFQPAGSPETEDYLIVKMPTKEGRHPGVWVGVAISLFWRQLTK